MRYVRAAAALLFVLLVPVFLVTTNVRWVINFPPLYSYGFSRYDIPNYTGIEMEELLSAGRQIRDYFNNDEEWLDVQVVVGGVIRRLYNSREIVHMRDVKGLVQGVYRAQVLTGTYLLAFAVVGLAFEGRSFARELLRYVRRGGLLTLGLVGAVGVAAAVGFDQLFLLFHIISFANDFWQLDPRRDYLIAMFPQGFFFDATMLIALSTVVEAALLAFLPRILGRRRRPEPAPA